MIQNFCLTNELHELLSSCGGRYAYSMPCRHEFQNSDDAISGLNGFSSQDTEIYASMWFNTLYLKMLGYKQ